MLRRISTSFLAQLWALVLSMGDRVILVGILLRVWGADIYADWATIFATVGLISMGEMGLNIYFGNGWQRAYAQKDEVGFQRFIGISLFTYLILGVCLATLVVGFALFSGFASKFSLHAFDSRTVLFVFSILTASQLLVVMRGSISQMYRGRGEFTAGIWIVSLVPLSKMLLAIIAVLLGASPLIVAVIYLLCEFIVGWGVMLFDLKRRFSHLRFRPERPTRSELGNMFKHGKWYAFIQGAPIAWLQIPILIISSLSLGSAALISFVLARTLVNFSRQITEMLSRSVGVEVATSFHLDDKTHLSSTLTTFGTFLSGLTGTIIGGSIIFGPPFTTIWSGNPSLFDPWVFFWLLIPSVVISPALPLKNLLMLGNLPRPVGITSFTQVIIGLILCYGLAHYYGVVGAAAGLAIGEAFALGIFLPYVGYHHIGKGYVHYFLTCVVVFIPTSLWSGFVAWLTLSIIGADSIPNFLGSCILWSLLGATPALALAIPLDRRKHIIQLAIVRIHGLRNPN